MSDDNFKSKANQLLNDLGQFLKLGELEFDEEDDTCMLILDDTIEINITPNNQEGTLVLHHLVGTLPQENRQEILEQLLEANLFWSGTAGGTISLERDSSLVILARALAIYNVQGELLTGEDLGNAIADLANASSYWKNLLELSDIKKENSDPRRGFSNQDNLEKSIDITILD